MSEPIPIGITGPHGPYLSDHLDILFTTQWLRALASRGLYAAIRRPIDPDHIIELLDVFGAYAARGSRYYDEDFDPVPWEQREGLARELRALMETWTPPALPQEIVDTARALLHAEGHGEPDGGWDSLRDDGIPVPLEDLLLWPEGVPAVRREAAIPPGPPLTVEEFIGPKPPRLSKEETGYIEIIYSDSWNGAVIHGQRVVRSLTGELPPGAEWGDVYGAIIWLMVLAAPQLYRALDPQPDRKHLLRLLDVFIAYAARGPGWHLTPAKKSRKLRLAEREALARKLKTLLEAWTPPELPEEITDAARDLVEAEGIRRPQGGWENLKYDKPYPLEDALLWPEGIPVVRRSKS